MSRSEGAAVDRAADLDARILDAIERWRRREPIADDALERLALDLFDYQVRTCEPYRRWCLALGFGIDRVPPTWRAIPAVPAAAFKDATIATFDVAGAELEFHTSGTTEQRRGKHYMERAALYDAALLAGFARFMLPDGVRPVFANLVPDPAVHPHSSLGYMMMRVAEHLGTGRPRFYLRGNDVDADGLRRDVRAAAEAGSPVCIAGTAFALTALLDALDGDAVACPPGSRMMETGGFKGRTRDVPRAQLYERLAQTFGIEACDIVAEYGMTELTSQYYDAPASRHSLTRPKTGPPWLRTVVVDARGDEVAAGEIGFLRHVDLANRSSVVAIQTEDRGYRTADGFVLLGREEGASLRGCSLDAEDLLRSARS